MYEGKIVAAAVATTPTDRREEGSVVLGLAVLLIALPVMAVRVFAWAVLRDLRKLATLAGIVGSGLRDARR